jgi:hypothetical protein
LLLFNKSPNDKDVVAATVVAIIIRADSVMARSGIADNKFNAPFFHIFSLSGSTKYEH